MPKVLKYNEVKKYEHTLYCECYIVDFLIQNENLWEQRSEKYFTKSKGDHKYVIRRWKCDYEKNNVLLSSVSFQ